VCYNTGVLLLVMNEVDDLSEEKFYSMRAFRATDPEYFVVNNV
jgi:hypothetical protein